jgi:hypothetical protein
LLLDQIGIRTSLIEVKVFLGSSESVFIGAIPLKYASTFFELVISSKEPVDLRPSSDLNDSNSAPMVTED